MEIRPTKLTTQILTTVINQKPQAYACVLGNKIAGSVCFYSFMDGSIMIYEIKGLPENEKGIFGFHIHEGHNCDDHFQNTKGHYDPDKQLHPYHLGDLPPLFATKGIAWGIIYIDKFKPKDIINRTIVIHEMPDDFHSQPAGNSGEKIACGEIKHFS